MRGSQAAVPYPQQPPAEQAVEAIVHARLAYNFTGMFHKIRFQTIDNPSAQHEVFRSGFCFG